MLDVNGTRAANRERLDLVVDAAVMQVANMEFAGWISVGGLIDRTGFSEAEIRAQLLYLDHCYGAVKPTTAWHQSMGWRFQPGGIMRYRRGQRTACMVGHCPCRGAGEVERTREEYGV